MSELSHFFNRRQFIKYSSLAVSTSLLNACSRNSSSTQTPSDNLATQDSTALDKVTYGTNWFAQAEHGGFYQAVATGIYEAHGLDVTIEMGGPQINGTQLLMGGAVDFFMGIGSDAIVAVEAGIPKITVAAIFQKDPQIILTHPNVGHDSLESLKGKPIYISAGSSLTYWPFLKSKYGFSDDQKRPYNSNVVPFLTDKQSSQQGYLSSEPLKVKREGGFDPVVFLLADYGYTPYSTTIETRKEIVDSNPDLVQRFVDASIKGWYSYFENPEPANKLIKAANPEMSDEQLAYSLEKMKEFGIVISGDAKTQGIGAMNSENWQSFFNTLVDTDVVNPDTDYTQAFTLDFVNKGVDYYK